ncbi:conserved hypothetical protein [Rubrivivax sp. A210]|uniref:hypothetical protein n=1 Tax=Rubrivivax sp. A210 TaxID=2772301 RepID=UPI00191892AF|nr:hypothetical protein [Rubrivivax sp. A210]CAD5366040.1 conserved hypothetical protein [Rubrivivax sp. A210]
MSTRALSADDLLAGAQATHRVSLPAALLPEGAAPGHVLLRPLTAAQVQRVAQASRDERLLASVLMVREALVEPKLAVEQVQGLSAGLLQFLLGEVNRLSGLSIADDDLEQAIKAPLTRACFVLAREFGWTPAECSALTVGQILLYLEMLARDERPANAAAPAVRRAV